jgi:hypothetical protein
MFVRHGDSSWPASSTASHSDGASLQRSHRAVWPISEADAMDLLQTVSLLHRRLDAAQLTP